MVEISTGCLSPELSYFQLKYLLHIGKQLNFYVIPKINACQETYFPAELLIELQKVAGLFIFNCYRLIGYKILKLFLLKHQLCITFFEKSLFSGGLYPLHGRGACFIPTGFHIIGKKPLERNCYYTGCKTKHSAKDTTRCHSNFVIGK